MIWILAIVLAVLVGLAFALRALIRTWASSNLFDRQYRFPPVTNVAIRLGADKSGGCMATVDFSERPQPGANSRTEDL